MSDLFLLITTLTTTRQFGPLRPLLGVLMGILLGICAALLQAQERSFPYYPPRLKSDTSNSSKPDPKRLDSNRLKIPTKPRLDGTHSNGPINTPQPSNSLRVPAQSDEDQVDSSQELELVGPFIPAPVPNGPLPDDSEPAWEIPHEPEPQTVTTSGASGSPISFWVVSARDCPQAGSPCLADRRMKYYYRSEDGRMTERSAADFYGTVDPNRPMCVMIHGSLMSLRQTLQEGQETFYWLKRCSPQTPFQFVLFTWPSERPLALVAPIDFSILGKQSGYNGFYLARMLTQLPPETAVSVIGHSHGARLAVSSLHLLGGGAMYGYRLSKDAVSVPRIRTVLAAAALDHHWLDPGQRYEKSLSSAESIVNLRNRTDYALILYPLRLPLGRQPLGLVGFNWRDQQLLGNEYGKVRDIEVSPLLGMRHIWPGFYKHLKIGQTITPYLFFQDDLPRMMTLRDSAPVTHDAPDIQIARPGPSRSGSILSGPHMPGGKPSGSSPSALVRGEVTPTSPRVETPARRPQELEIAPGKAILYPQQKRLFSLEKAVQPARGTK